MDHAHQPCSLKRRLRMRQRTPLTRKGRVLGKAGTSAARRARVMMNARGQPSRWYDAPWVGYLSRVLGFLGSAFVVSYWIPEQLKRIEVERSRDYERATWQRDRRLAALEHTSRQSHEAQRLIADILADQARILLPCARSPQACREFYEERRAVIFANTMRLTPAVQEAYSSLTEASNLVQPSDPNGGPPETGGDRALKALRVAQRLAQLFEQRHQYVDHRAAECDVATTLSKDPQSCIGLQATRHSLACVESLCLIALRCELLQSQADARRWIDHTLAITLAKDTDGMSNTTHTIKSAGEQCRVSEDVMGLCYTGDSPNNVDVLVQRFGQSGGCEL
jgi:hypothetical protein